ncbi:hypothetical protein ACLOJK_010392 [Asimina triloba]
MECRLLPVSAQSSYITQLVYELSSTASAECAILRHSALNAYAPPGIGFLLCGRSRIPCAVCHVAADKESVQVELTSLEPGGQTQLSSTECCHLKSGFARSDLVACLKYTIIGFDSMHSTL